jgi:lysophospholipase L1-like esterase
MTSAVVSASALLLKAPTMVSRALAILTISAMLFVVLHALPASKHPAALRVIAVGDSLTAGYYRKTPRDAPVASIGFAPYASALQAALGPNAAVVPLGVPGITSQGLLDIAHSRKLVPMDGASISAPQIPGLVAAIAKYRPHVAVLLAGTNDVFRAVRLFVRLSTRLLAIATPYAPAIAFTHRLTYIAANCKPPSYASLQQTPDQLNGAAIASRVWRLHRIAHELGVKTMALGMPGWGPERVAETPLITKLRLDARADFNRELKRLAAASGGLATFLDFPFEFSNKNSQLYAISKS